MKSVLRAVYEACFSTLFVVVAVWNTWCVAFRRVRFPALFGVRRVEKEMKSAFFDIP